jgi:hypothetical protein
MMHAALQRWLDGAGSLFDPAEAKFCQIFDAIAAVSVAGAADIGAAAIPELTAGALTAGADIGAAALPALSTAADISIPLDITATALPAAGADIGGAAALGAGAAGAGALDTGLAGLTAGEAGGGEVAAAAGDLAPGITSFADLMPGGFGPTDLTTALTPTSPFSTAPTQVADIAAPGTSVGGPVATSPPVPAGVGDSGAATGQFGGAGGDTTALGDFSPRSDVAAGDFSPRSDVAGAASKGGLNEAIKKATGGLLDKSDLGSVLSAGGMLMNFMNRNKKLPGEAELNRAAGSLTATAQGQAALGAQLESFLNSGQLPPGISAGLRTATEAAKAHIRSGYASRGMSGSSAEAQDVQAAEDRALAAGQEVALNLLQQGATIVGQSVNTEGLAAQLYQTILANALQKDNALGAAIGNFSSALAGSSGGGNTITVKAA